MPVMPTNICCLSLVLLVVGLALVTKAKNTDNVIDEGQDILNTFYDRYNATKEVDLVFVLDRSGSVPRPGWSSMLEFVEKILEHFTVDRDNTRVAIVTFSTTARVDINDLELINETITENKCTLSSRITEKVERRWPSGYTATYDALNKTFNILLNSRPNSKKAVLVLTDGKSNIGPPPVKIAVDILSLRWGNDWNEEALGPQVEIYAFGIGNDLTAELISIASNLEKHYFLIPRFSLFADFARSLHGGLQYNNWVRTNEQHCSSRCQSISAICMCGSKIGKSRCVCQPGYQMEDGHCRECPIGSYKPTFLPEMCRSCPENMTTDAIGGSSPDDCVYLPGHRRCPPLNDIANGVKFQVTGSRIKDEILNTGLPCENVTDGNSCHYECDVGFRLSGSPVMVCNHTGSWLGDVPTCDAIDCHKPKTILGDLEGGTLNYLQNSTMYGSTVEVVCDSDRVPLPDVTSWTCNAHGRWTMPRNFRCERVFCTPFEPKPYMSVVPTRCATEQSIYGTVCNLTCDDGFILRGKPTKTCGYDRDTRWLPWAKVACHDIEAPVIECPADIEIIVADFSDNSIKIHSGWKPEMLMDNSGKVEFKIENLPSNGEFLAGTNTILHYVAKDASGNEAKCSQNVHVKEKKIHIDPETCPSQIVKHGGKQVVTWTDPAIYGPTGEPLKVTCFPESGSTFYKEETKVVCQNEEHAQEKCKFNVIIKPIKCPDPSGYAPVRGSLACGVNEDLVNYCHMMCPLHYSMNGLVKGVTYKCNKNGVWNPQFDEKPLCFFTLYGDTFTTKEKLKIRFNGTCEDNKENIKSAFETNMRMILANKDVPCDGPYDCTVTDVVVKCGPQRRKKRLTVKRSVAGDEILFNMVVNGSEMANITLNDTKSEQEKDDQSKLIDTLRQVTGYIARLVYVDRSFEFDVGGSTVVGEDFEHESKLPLEAECGPGQFRKMDGESMMDLSNIACVTCAPGTYYVSMENRCGSCPKGTYQTQEGQDHCDPCPVNTTTVYNGAWGPNLCKASCEVGFSSPTGLEPCFPVCREGHYSETGYEPCFPCEIGTFQHLTEQTECTQCPENTTTAMEGTTSISDCGVLCSVNRFSRNGIEPCVACPPGTYQPLIGQNTECLMCNYSQEMDNKTKEYCPDPVDCLGYNVTCHHGYCVVSNTNKTQCWCNPGYHGDACELDIDECLYADCYNGGSCQDEVNGFSCNCTAAFAGRQCEKYVGACVTEPCFNNASCVDRNVTFECVCPLGYNGTLCEQPIDPCASNPCNHGECTPDGILYECHCDYGYAGSNCQKTIDFCSNVTCLHGGTCSSNGTDVGCACPRGFFGTYCEKLVDYCTPDPCQDRGRCLNTVGSYYCVCDSQHFGIDCLQAGSPSFDLRFDGESHVSLPMWEQLPAMSVCLWLRASDEFHTGTVFSYTTRADSTSHVNVNVLAMFDPAQLKVAAQSMTFESEASLNDGYWHHICTRTSIDGVDVFLNGSNIVSEAGKFEGPTEVGGLFTLGQRQTHVYQDFFDPSKGFHGEISHLNVYSYLLTDNDIKDLANDTVCVPGNGDIISWTSFLGEKMNGANISSQSYCLDTNECMSPDRCEADEVCLDALGGYQCVPCGNDCQDPIPIDDFCSSSPCENSGTCIPSDINFRCDCAVGFTGATCELMFQNCSSMSCKNNGQCEENGDGARCNCPWPWYGRYCEVFYEPTCIENPCLNSGECTISDSKYHCECPQDGRYYGENCEELTPCDASPQPCINGATCIVIDDNVTCLCPRDYQGDDCRFVPVSTTQPSTTTHDPCSGIDCKNKGTCRSVNSEFECHCPYDYEGQYCEVKKEKVTTKYFITVSLNKPYKPGLKKNESFKTEFGQQVHKVYSRKIDTGKFFVQVQDVRNGSIEVDFILQHTVTEDEEIPGKALMKDIIYKELENNTLGDYPASLHNFKFNYIAPTNVMDWAIYLIIALVVITIVVVLVIVVYVYLRRRRCRGPRKLNNMPLVELNRVENPAFEPDSGPATPQMRHLQDDNIYSDLGEPTPYAIDLCSGEKPNEPELVKNFPSKRGRDINKDWDHVHRQSIPLPPKPGEHPMTNGREDGGYLLPCSGVPPPPYRDVDQRAAERYGRNNLNPDIIRPMSALEEKYGTDEDFYLQPKDNRTKAQGAGLHVYINNEEATKPIDEQQATYLPLLPASPQEEIEEEPDSKEELENDREESPDYLVLKKDKNQPDAIPDTDKDAKPATNKDETEPPKPIMRNINKKDKDSETPTDSATPSMRPSSVPVAVAPPIPPPDSPPAVDAPPTPLSGTPPPLPDTPPPLPTCPPPDDDELEQPAGEDQDSNKESLNTTDSSNTTVYAIKNGGS